MLKKSLYLCVAVASLTLVACGGEKKNDETKTTIEKVVESSGRSTELQCPP